MWSSISLFPYQISSLPPKTHKRLIHYLEKKIKIKTIIFDPRRVTELPLGGGLTTVHLPKLPATFHLKFCQ